MRQVVLDTETTGLDPKLGHRVIEIACVELNGRRLTQRHFHRYLNPDRDIDEGALAVHGITREFLADKPHFRDIVGELLDFVRDAELVIHNASFDIGFLNHELSLLGMPALATVSGSVLDTLKLARSLHPGKRNSLDALCERYQINNAHRTLHGALLDTELLAEVYLAMTRGQESLIGDEDATGSLTLSATPGDQPRPPLRVLAASTEELAAHTAYLGGLDKSAGGACLWRQMAPSAASQ